MRVLVCGAGEVGFNIARHLAAEDNDVVVIDQAPERIEKVGEALDVQAMLGFASHPDVLKLAGAEDADMLIAVTQSDEINIVACQVAHSLFNVPTKIARIRHQAYLDPAWADLFSRAHMPIDVVISPEVEVANSIGRRLEVPGALDMTSFADDRVRLVGVRLGESCPVVNTPLGQLNELFPDLNITIVCIVRNEVTLFPERMEQLVAGDEVYFVAETAQLARAMVLFGHEEQAARRLVIIGGGNIGLLLARQIEKTNPNINLKLIEFDKERAEFVADRLERTIVINGDALDTDILKEANIANTETVLAVTANDEVNVLASVLAKRHGCARAVTLVNSSTYAPLISPLGIDASVSPRGITVSSILQHIRRGRIRSVYSLRGGEAEVIEAEAMATSPLVGPPLKDVKLPKGVLVGAIVRGEEVIIPRAANSVKEHDRVIIFAPHDAVKKVERMFAVALGFF
ncbi:MAG TPA: Trk system potassium transporter TrkA [Alphaproteobacteria bacterium]